MARGDRSECYRAWYLAHQDQERDRAKQYAQEHQEARNAYQNRHRQLLREFIREQKQGKSCIRCGIADHRVLDFHHRDPSQKRASLSKLWKQNAGRRAIMDEIAKCDLLCANCHRILHWEAEDEE
jgi:hypothetical protein